MTLIVIQVLYCYVFQQRSTCNHKRIVLLTDMQNASLCNDEIWACWTAGWPAWQKKKIVNVVIFFKYETLHKFSCIWCAVGRLFAE